MRLAAEITLLFMFPRWFKRRDREKSKGQKGRSGRKGKGSGGVGELKERWTIGG